MEIIILFSQYLLISFFIKNSAIEMIEQIGTNSKLYPKHYCMPSPWMRKCFKLKKNELPNYLYYRLYVSIGFLILAPITSIICLCTQFNTIVIGGMLVAPCLFVIVDTVQFIVVSHIFKT